MKHLPNPRIRMRHYPPLLAHAAAVAGMYTIHQEFDAFRVQADRALRELYECAHLVLLAQDYDPGQDTKEALVSIKIRNIASDIETCLRDIRRAYEAAAAENPFSDDLMNNALGALGQIQSDCEAITSC